MIYKIVISFLLIGTIIFLNTDTPISKGDFIGCFKSQSDSIEFSSDGTFQQISLQGQNYNRGTWRVFEFSSQNQKNMGGVIYNFLSESVFSRDEHDFQVYKNWSGDIYFELPSDYRDSPPAVYTKFQCASEGM